MGPFVHQIDCGFDYTFMNGWMISGIIKGNQWNNQRKNAKIMPDCKIAACQISAFEFDEDKVWFNLQQQRKSQNNKNKNNKNKNRVNTEQTVNLDCLFV